MGIRNLKFLTKVKERISNIHPIAHQSTQELALILHQYIQAEINVSLGDKAKHFDTTIISSGKGFRISVRPVDDIGKFIYYGTEGHSIRASSGTAIPVGGGDFAQSAQIPARPGMKNEIDMAVELAKVKALQTNRGLKGRI